MVRFLTSAAIAAAMLTSVPSVAQTDSLPAVPIVDNVPLRMTTTNFWALGLQAGITSGSGISVRYSIPSRVSVEVTGGYISISDGIWSIGAEAQFTLNASPDSRLYAMLGSGYHADMRDTGGNQLKQPFRLGIGPGYEVFISRQFAIGAELPITIFFGGENVVVLPLPQLQAMFYFN